MTAKKEYKKDSVSASRLYDRGLISRRQYYAVLGRMYRREHSKKMRSVA